MSYLVPVPKKPWTFDPTDYQPIAFTSDLIKDLGRLVFAHLCLQEIFSLDPLQFAYQLCLGMRYAVIYLLQRPGHTAPKHPWNGHWDSYGLQVSGGTLTANWTRGPTLRLCTSRWWQGSTSWGSWDPSACAAGCWTFSTNLLLLVHSSMLQSAGEAASELATPTDWTNWSGRLENGHHRGCVVKDALSTHYWTEQSGVLWTD